METRRVLLAGFLIVLVWVVWQSLFFSPPPSTPTKTEVALSDKKAFNILESSFVKNSSSFKIKNEIVLTVNNGKFIAEISNGRLGSFLQYSLSEQKKQYLGSYVIKEGTGEYDPLTPVSFLFSKKEGYVACNPCIEGLNPVNVVVKIDGAVQNESREISVINKEVTIEFVDVETLASHIMIIAPNDFSVLHSYSFKNDFSPKRVFWKNGTRPSEKYYWLDDQMSYAMFVGKDSDDYNWLTGNLETDSLEYAGALEWAGTRNKFFTSILKPISKASDLKIIPKKDYSFIKKYSRFVPKSPPPPSVYDVSMTFGAVDSFSFESFLAPLDHSIVADSNIKNLDWIMTLGASVFRPISIFILKTIQFIKSYLPFGGYAFVLIIFAFIVRAISGPLSKRSLESTKKMTSIQPLIKEIQEKHKNDPKKMQMKIMAAYKENKVNPLSGCLLMFLQWPIMIPPFIVFRSAVELRGESFLWLSDLSHPDYLITLPFNIPLLGFGNETGIGVLPILMGVTLFLTMKQTAANLEGQNKVMMYSMNGMFVFLFNSFPAGLNLYYVVYNLLNYLQQRGTSSKK